MHVGTIGRAALAVVLLGGVRMAAAQDLLPITADAKPAAEHKADEHKNGHTPETAPHPETEEAAQEEEHSKWFFVGEYWLVQPRRRALNFAIIDPNQDGFPQGSIQSIDLDSASGFRVGAGYENCEHWTLGAYYTYFFTGNNRDIFAPQGGTLYATLPHAGTVFAVDQAMATSGLKYQVLDVEGGRRFESGEHMSFWVGGGGRFAFIEQSLRAVYNGQSAYLAVVDSPIQFDGGGLRLGAEGDFKVGHGLGFYGRAFGSLLAGNFNTSLTETNNNGAAVITAVSEHYRKVVPVAELGLGMYWKRDQWKALVGYEFTNYFGLVDSPDFVHDYTNKLSYRTSDLSLDGLRIGLQIDY